jgi:lipopolysaccharide transport system permease protein
VTKKSKNTWLEIITPKKHIFDINLKELWDYKYLLLLFVKRDFVSIYKQTILGPLWFFIQPVFTTLIFTVIFGQLASIPTDGLPQILFYMCGITCWSYFSESLSKTSNVFILNASIFGKVYFPRLILPISIVISNLFKFVIQFILFISFLLYYYFNDANINPNIYILTTPILLILMAGLGLGFGIIISSLTTKYRDLQFLVIFGVQLFMYATPIVYPLSLAKEKLGEFSWIALLNPMTSIIETMKYSFLGQGEFSWYYLGYSFIFMIITLFIGTIIFNKVEQNFMDTV